MAKWPNSADLWESCKQVQRASDLPVAEHAHCSPLDGPLPLGARPHPLQFSMTRYPQSPAEQHWTDRAVNNHGSKAILRRWIASGALLSFCVIRLSPLRMLPQPPHCAVAKNVLQQFHASSVPTMPSFLCFVFFPAILGDMKIFVARISDLLSTPDDDVTQRHVKMLVFSSLGVIGTCGILWSSLYLFLKCWWQAVFPFLYTGVAILAMIHFVYSKNVAVARACLTYGLVLCPIGICWTFGNEYSAVVTNWAFLGPQLACTLGYGFAAVNGCFAVVLCGAVLCGAVLCCVALCCVALSCVVLCCVVLRCVVLCCVALRCVVLCCVVLCCVVLRCVVLRCVALRCVVLVVLCCVVLCCVVLCCVVLCCVVLCCVVLCCVVLCCVVLCCIRIVSQDGQNAWGRRLGLPRVWRGVVCHVL